MPVAGCRTGSQYPVARGPWTVALSPMAEIRIVEQSPTVFLVTVDDGQGTSHHEVTIMPSDVDRYAPGWAPEEVLEAAFLFLLEREPKEAILPRFDLPVIERYFPEFATAFGG